MTLRVVGLYVVLVAGKAVLKVVRHVVVKGSEGGGGGDWVRRGLRGLLCVRMENLRNVLCGYSDVVRGSCEEHCGGGP